MIGDTALQLTVFGIGVVVFTSAMVGGFLAMKQWKERDNERALAESQSWISLAARSQLVDGFSTHEYRAPSPDPGA